METYISRKCKKRPRSIMLWKHLKMYTYLWKIYYLVCWLRIKTKKIFDLIHQRFSETKRRKHRRKSLNHKCKHFTFWLKYEKNNWFKSFSNQFVKSSDVFASYYISNNYQYFHSTSYISWFLTFHHAIKISLRKSIKQVVTTQKLNGSPKCSYRELDNNSHALYGLYKLLIEINGR